MGPSQGLPSLPFVGSWLAAPCFIYSPKGLVLRSFADLVWSLGDLFPFLLLILSWSAGSLPVHQVSLEF